MRDLAQKLLVLHIAYISMWMSTPYFISHIITLMALTYVLDPKYKSPFF